MSKINTDYMNSSIELTERDYMEVYDKASDLFISIMSNEKSLTWSDITINHEQNALYYNDRLIASEFGFESEGYWHNWDCEAWCESSTCWIEEEEFEGATWISHYIANEAVKNFIKGEEL